MRIYEREKLARQQFRRYLEETCHGKESLKFVVSSGGIQRDREREGGGMETTAVCCVSAGK